VSAYALSWLIAELPYVLILVGTFLNVFYWACGYSRDADRFFMYWLFLWEVVTFYTYFGQFIGTLPNIKALRQTLHRTMYTPCISSTQSP
jgi:ABC-type multidrug transport system permease subunit